MKTWHEVELRREYLRGYRDGFNEAVYDDGNVVDPFFGEFASLEALKPCAWCGGDGKAHTGVPLNDCPCCGGTGIAKEKEEDHE